MGSFFADWRRVRVEGFRLQELLNACLKEDIRLRRIHRQSEISMTLEITEEDWSRFRRLAGSRWRLTTLERRGAKPLLFRILNRKSALAGLALFIFLVYYQSLFIHEIQISGYSRLTETEIREALAEAGLYEGCRKTLNPKDVEIAMYTALEDIAYFGVKYRGCLAEVYVSERTQVPPLEDKSQPCHVVAGKSGYIYQVTATDGSPVVIADQYVGVGEVLISGAFTVQDTTFEGLEDGRMVYAHAEGEVLAKVPYRLRFYQERYDLADSYTGRQAPGIALKLGEKSFRTDSVFRPYDTAVSSETPIISLKTPIPFYIGAITSKEVAFSKVERTGEEIEKLADVQLRTWAGKNLPESAEILNKGLKFTVKDNIIEVDIMLEVLEDIGIEQPLYGRMQSSD